MLAFAKTLDGGGIRGVDAQMESADALDGDDLAGEQAVDGSGYRSVGTESVLPSGRFEPDARAAIPAGVGLGVKAAVERIVVFGLAGRAHCELRHRGLRPVVGNAARDGEARAAVGAVEEGIAIAAVVRTKSSRRQSAHVAASAGMPVADLAFDLAGDDAKAVSPTGWRSWTSTESMRARGGASERRRGKEGFDFAQAGLQSRS